MVDQLHFVPQIAEILLAVFAVFGIVFGCWQMVRIPGLERREKFREARSAKGASKISFLMSLVVVLAVVAPALLGGRWL